MSYHFIPIRLATVSRAIIPIANGDTEKIVFSFTASGSINYYSPLKEQLAAILKIKGSHNELGKLILSLWKNKHEN